MRTINDFGKEVKKKLIDMEKTQKWLLGEVNGKTGLSADQSYLWKVINGKTESARVKNAISEILGIGS